MESSKDAGHALNHIRWPLRSHTARWVSNDLYRTYSSISRVLLLRLPLLEVLLGKARVDSGLFHDSLFAFDNKIGPIINYAPEYKRENLM